MTSRNNPEARSRRAGNGPQRTPVFEAAYQLELLRTLGVEVVVLDDQRSVDMMRTFQSDNDLWAEDIAE